MLCHYIGNCFWRVCADAQAPVSLSRSSMRYVPKSHVEYRNTVLIVYNTSISEMGVNRPRLLVFPIIFVTILVYIYMAPSNQGTWSFSHILCYAFIVVINKALCPKTCIF